MSKNNAIFFIVDTYDGIKYDYHGYYLEADISSENFKNIVKNLYNVQDFEKEILDSQFNYYCDNYKIEKIDNENWNEIYQHRFASKAYEISKGKAFDEKYISRMMSINGKAIGISYIENDKANYSNYKLCFKSKKNKECYNKSTGKKVKEINAEEKLENVFQYITGRFSDITPTEVENMINNNIQKIDENIR